MSLPEVTEYDFGAFLLIALPVLSAILLATFGLPSFFIALGVLRASYVAIGFALLYDALILGFSILRVISTLGHLRPYYVWDAPDLSMRCAPWVGLGLAFAAEAAYILRRAWKWRPAWPVFALLAAGLVLIITIVPQVLRAPVAQEVQPLLTYVNAHWVKITPSTRVALGQRSSNAGYHTDEVTIRGENATWRLSAVHRRDGRWTFPKPRFGDPTFMGFPYPAIEERLVASLDEAKMLLRDCGVPDSDLHPQRVVTEHFEFSTEPAYTFWFWSPLAQGRYRVYCDNRVRPIEFYLDQAVEVP